MQVAISLCIPVKKSRGELEESLKRCVDRSENVTAFSRVPQEWMLKEDESFEEIESVAIIGALIW